MTIQQRSLSKKGSKKVTKAGAKAVGRRRTRRESYATYINRVLKSNEGNFTISSRAMAIVNSFVHDNFERFAGEASLLASRSRRSTISSREMQSAIRLCLSGNLVQHAVANGTKALSQYNSTQA